MRNAAWLAAALLATAARADFGSDMERSRDRQAAQQIAAQQQTTTLIVAGMVCVTVVVCFVWRGKRRSDAGA